MIEANLTYLLDTLAGFEESDIEDDEFEVAVNDDQFGSCSIVAVAQAASDRIKELERALTNSLIELKSYEKTAGKMPYTKSRRKYFKLIK